MLSDASLSIYGPVSASQTRNESKPGTARPSPQIAGSQIVYEEIGPPASGTKSNKSKRYPGARLPNNQIFHISFRQISLHSKFRRKKILSRRFLSRPESFRLPLI